MKKFFTLVFATLMANSMMAQMHGTLNFAGAPTAHVLTTDVEMIILLYLLSPLRM